jgi:hypothetical protein
LVIGAAIAEPYGTRRFVAFMGNGYVMRENWFYSLTTWAGAFPVYRDNPKPALIHGLKLLKEGIALFMSPQGRRVGKSPVDDYFNLTMDPRSGVGRLVLWSNGEIPVVPAFIHGASAALAQGKILPRFKSYISVSFGEPLTFKEYARDEGWTDEDPEFFINAKKIAERIMVSINEQMLEQEKYLLKIVEKKYKKRVLEISEEERADKGFRRFLRNLCNYSPEELQQKIEESKA